MSFDVTPEKFLLCATPSAWIEVAVAHQDILLIDHAHCEKKAASSALALLFRYPERHTLVATLSRLAREELRHFEQVLRILQRRGIPYRKLTASRYAEGLRRHVRHAEPGRLVDTLIVGAFIEARSCERFALLAPHLPADLREFYGGLQAAEARHFREYLDLAQSCAAEALEPHIARFAQIEAELVTTPDPVFRFHSGVPVLGAR